MSQSICSLVVQLGLNKRRTKLILFLTNWFFRSSHLSDWATIYPVAQTRTLNKLTPSPPPSIPPHHHLRRADKSVFLMDLKPVLSSPMPLLVPHGLSSLLLKISHYLSSLRREFQSSAQHTRTGLQDLAGPPPTFCHSTGKAPPLVMPNSEWFSPISLGLCSPWEAGEPHFPCPLPNPNSVPETPLFSQSSCCSLFSETSHSLESVALQQNCGLSVSRTRLGALCREKFCFVHLFITRA